jgi:hypothetical protein
MIGSRPAKNRSWNWQRRASRIRLLPALLHVSENTVAVHRANLMAELGIHRTTDLIIWAVKKGLIHLP